MGMRLVGADAIYKNYITDQKLDRLEVFTRLRESYGNDIQYVLYPGCFVHITPSFVFSHVTYVDKDPYVLCFFNNRAAVEKLIALRKIYDCHTYIEFIFGDYFKTLPLREGGYDLLIALYAPEVSLSCKKYLRNGGLLLTNDHLNDGGRAASDTEYRLIAVFEKKAGKLRITNRELERFFKIQVFAHGRAGNAGLISGKKPQRDLAPYYVFEKIMSNKEKICRHT
jgi:hypothetical protein